MLQAQARTAYLTDFADQPWPARTHGAVRISYLKPLVLIAVVVVPWTAILWLGWLLVRAVF